MLTTWSLLLLFLKCYSMVFVCAGSFAVSGYFSFVASGGFSLVVVCELLIVVGFCCRSGLLNLLLPVELWAQQLSTWTQSPHSMWSLLEPRSNPYPPAGRFLTTRKSKSSAFRNGCSGPLFCVTVFALWRVACLRNDDYSCGHSGTSDD